jgi:hypothetical protein
LTDAMLPGTARAARDDTKVHLGVSVGLLRLRWT